MDNRVIRFGGSDEEQEQYRALVKQHGSPLLILDCNELRKRYRLLQEQLPGADLYYAIKAFAHPAALEILSEMGANFDVASAGEIELLRDLQISGRRTIHTHPIKKDADIKAALRGGSTTFVVDNIDELKKLIPYKQRIGLLLRVSFRSDTAKVDLSRKFGCAPEQVPELVHQAAELGVHVRGLSFHVGSQSLTPDAHVDAIKRCAALIAKIEQRENRPMDVLDIGGGFPVDYDMTGFDADSYFAPIRTALKELPEHISVIAEPGRFLIAPAVTGISSVTGKARRGDYLWYYLDDGIYGSYSGQLFDHTIYPLQIFNDASERKRSILAGPTCDSIDIIAEDVELPELQEGDLIIGYMMGAYTHATSTRFNSIEAAMIIVINK